MTTRTNFDISEPASGRRYDLDWMRLIAIVILLFFHTGMLFNTWDWHIKNSETSASFTYWMVWLHYWRMPLLLFISGAGTYMALGKRTPGQYAGERFKRLLIPLMFGMFVIVPPQIYFEHIREYNDYGDFYKTVFNFIPYPEGSFSWHHLWFVMYLLVYSLLAIPFLKFLRSSRSASFREKTGRFLSSPAAILFVPSLLILASQIILRPWFPEQTHALVNDWAYFVFYFCFFLFGMLCYSSVNLWQSIGANRNYLLAASLFILIPFYLAFFHFRDIIRFPWSNDTVEVIFDVASIFVSWFWVITVIAYGQHYLNRPHPWLKHFNEGLYPFYILHQTVIIALGYYISQLSWGIFAKFWTVNLLTLTSCLLIYFVLIKPFRVTRVLFGMKVKKKNATVEKEAMPQII
jgi:glucans biosynthesis protein C